MDRPVVASRVPRVNHSVEFCRRVHVSFRRSVMHLARIGQPQPLPSIATFCISSKVIAFLQVFKLSLSSVQFDRNRQENRAIIAAICTVRCFVIVITSVMLSIYNIYYITFKSFFYYYFIIIFVVFLFVISFSIVYMELLFCYSNTKEQE